MKATWRWPFSHGDTAPAPFYAPSGTLQVPMMHRTGRFGYLPAPGYRALELPYRGGRLAFDVLLPDPGELPALLSHLARRGPLALLHGLVPTRLEIALPRLTLRTQLVLNDTLRGLGMRSAFEPRGADLSGIAGRPGDLFIFQVAHEAYIRVDEAGTEAAAATAVGIAGTSVMAPPSLSFDVDRPFVFGSGTCARTPSSSPDPFRSRRASRSRCGSVSRPPSEWQPRPGQPRPPAGSP